MNRDDELTPEERRSLIDWVKAKSREGADALHSRAVSLEQRHKPTPTEELARARARADKEARS